MGFPSRKQENWKFLDISQIIKKNIGDLSFFNDYSIPNKIDPSIFVDGLEHNKIIFINGRIEKIDFNYEDQNKIQISDEIEKKITFDNNVEGRKAEIKMTLTTPNCPVAESLPKEVKEGAMQVEEIEDVVMSGADIGQIPSGDAGCASGNSNGVTKIMGVMPLGDPIVIDASTGGLQMEYNTTQSSKLGMTSTANDIYKFEVAW